MKSISDLNYLPFLLVIMWMGWSVVSSGTAHGAELPSSPPLTLPSDRQCQALWVPESVGKQPLIKAEIEGWCLIITRSKGNCLACHGIDVKPLPEGLATAGNIAPMLVNTWARTWVNKTNRLEHKITLKNIIYNAASKNPHTVMPLFGKHEILTETEIDRIIDFLMTL